MRLGFLASSHWRCGQWLAFSAVLVPRHTWDYLGRFRNEPAAVAAVTPGLLGISWNLHASCAFLVTLKLKSKVVQLVLRYSLWKKHDALPEVFDTRAESPTQARPPGTKCIILIDSDSQKDSSACTLAARPRTWLMHTLALIIWCFCTRADT